MAILSTSRSFQLHCFSPLPSLRLPSASALPHLRRSLFLRPPLSAIATSSSAPRVSQPLTPARSLVDSPEIEESGDTHNEQEQQQQQQQKHLLAAALALGLMLGTADAAMAFGGPEGPLVEEFWDNMRRYGLYFLTVATGGIYSILEPVFSLLRNPFTAVLTVAAISGSIYLLYLTINTMLGITAFDYTYAT